ncbi:MAG: ABC transporter ATP-binding protein [Bacteroidota bacterium]
MKKYLAFFQRYRKAVFLAPLLVVVDVVCEIVQPELMSKVVDEGVKRQDFVYILSMGGLMFGLSLVAIAANVGNVYYSSRASAGFAAELRKGLFDKIQEFSFSNLDRFGSNTLITRVTGDVLILQEVIMMSLRLLIRAPLMLIFAVVISVRINAGLATVIAIAIPVLAAAIFILMKRSLPFFEKMQRKLDKLNEVLQENLINVRVVKSFSREDFEKKKFGVTSDELRELAVRASGTVVLIMPVMQLVMNLSIVAIIWFGGNQIIAGSFQVGELMSFITYITQILMSLMMLSMTIMTLSRARASSVRILEVLNTESDIRDTGAAIGRNLIITQGGMEFRDVYFKYYAPGDEYVLKNINLQIRAGEKVGILGPTGSAKSTLVQLVPRLYDTTKGNITIDGHDIKDYTLHNLRHGVCLILQQNELFSGTIRENLKWGDINASDEEIIEAAKDAQAHDFIMSFPEGYNTVLGQGGVNISGGQKQRLCIARALLRKPAILIMDDSTSAVDTATEIKIWSSFRDHFPNTTTLVIAQRITSLVLADRIIILDNGEIVASGTHDQLLKTSTIYQEIYSSQQLQPAEI